MYVRKVKKIAFALIAVLFIGGAMAALVMMLWNWLMPGIFGYPMISFWQALGLLILAKVLFGGFMHKKTCSCCKHPDSEWENLSQEDKQSLKQRFMKKWADCHTSDHDKSQSVD